MNVSNVRALCFDTGGTILDWHTGMRTALAAIGSRHGVERDWTGLANEFRRRSLKLIVNHGEHAPATMTFDDAHRDALDQVLADSGLADFSEQERRTPAVGYDPQPEMLAGLSRVARAVARQVHLRLFHAAELPHRHRHRQAKWPVLGCRYLLRGNRQIQGPARSLQCLRQQFLQLDPSECCMVACHNFDLNAAKACGYNTAFVRRPDEWGAEGPPDPEPDPRHDIVVASFPELAEKLGA